jgi:hypothetical protein
MHTCVWYVCLKSHRHTNINDTYIYIYIYKRLTLLHQRHTNTLISHTCTLLGTSDCLYELSPQHVANPVSVTPHVWNWPGASDIHSHFFVLSQKVTLEPHSALFWQNDPANFEFCGCMYVCMYVYRSSCIKAGAFLAEYIYIYIHTYIHTYIYIYIYSLICGIIVGRETSLNGFWHQITTKCHWKPRNLPSIVLQIGVGQGLFNCF